MHPEHWRTPLVGRNDALAHLAAAWASLVPDGVEVALVVGEPGIGESRLAARFAAEVHAGGATVLAGRAEHAVEQPYAPVLEALEGQAPDLREDRWLAGARTRPRLASRLRPGRRPSVRVELEAEGPQRRDLAADLAAALEASPAAAAFWDELAQFYRRAYLR